MREVVGMIIFMVIFTLLIVIIGLPMSSSPEPKTTPYIENEILYLKLKSIPITDIINIEVVREPVIYVIITHKNGLYSMPYEDFQKVERELWSILF